MFFVASRPFDLGPGKGQLEVTASIGIASCEASDTAPETLLGRADKALYAAKSEGRNKVVGQAA